MRGSTPLSYMAAVATQAGLGLFTAIAFSATSEAMKYIDPDGADKERERHDKAMEDLSRAKEQFYEAEIQQKNERERRLRNSRLAAVGAAETNDALDRLAKALEITYKGKKYDREPNIGDFYQPSDSFVTASYVVMSTFGAGIGVATVLLYRYIRRK